MVQHQIPGGPDSFGMWSDDNCGIGHNRLAILCLNEAGNQPMHYGDWVLSYNGEIYNHQHLRDEDHFYNPIIGKSEYKGSSDTETLIHLIARHGVEKTVEQLEGMFAFAAYNKRTKELYLVTDHLSIKPLYYHWSNDRFIFASSIAAIAQHLDTLKFDRQSLIDYLALGSTYEPLFKGINKLHGGMILKVDMNFICTYSPYTTNIHNSKSLIETVEESIQSVKLSDVPLFLFLSGGIDSSVVAGCLPGVGAVHLSSPEQKYALEVSRKFNNNVTTIYTHEENAEECFKDYSSQSGDCSMAALIPYITSKYASKLGKVAISANGADELFFGYPRTTEHTTDAQLDHIFRKDLYKDSTWRDIVTSNSREVELQTYVQYDLNKTLDYASMCFGLEVRVPFLNQSIVRKAMELDRSGHVDTRLGGKRILKEWLLAKGFSQEFVTRPKVGFSLTEEPKDLIFLRKKGVELLKSQFDISLKAVGRDQRYFENSAAAFYCWWMVWKDRLS